MKTKLLLLLTISIFAISTAAQNLGQVADKTFGYIKASTFGKPNVIKKTSKLSIGQVRVHYKLVTSRDKKQDGGSADVTTYLESDLTKGDLQNLTNEFYGILQQKLSAVGISTTDWKAIEATETFQKALKKQEDKKASDYDGKSGQAWISFTSFDGPMLLKFKPFGRSELIGYGQQKDFKKLAEQTGGDFLSMDLVVDFASITLDAEVRQDKGVIFYGDPYFHAEYKIGGMMNIPNGFIWLSDAKNGFDQYKIELPIAERTPFVSAKIYEDASKASAANKDTFGDGKIKFTPVIIPTKREMYLAAARKVLTLYADMFVEKIKFVRGGESQNNVAQDKPQTTQTNTVNNERNQPQTDGQLDRAAEEAIKQGDYKLAVEYYSKIINRSSDDRDFEYLLKRSQVYMDYLKDHKSALKDCEEGIKQKPNEPAFYYNRATIYLHQKDYKKSRKEFDSYLTMSPNYADGYINRGIVNIYLKDIDAALADFTKAIQLNPRNPLPYRNRAAIYKAKGNLAAAQADEITAARLGN
ncbi:MAG: tetratricopeptide repeat protein [Pyrinomonadaceae bacterium]